MGLPDQPQGGDPGQWNRWRGATDQKLANIETDVDEIKVEQKAQHDTLNAIPADVVKAIKNGPAAPGNGQPVTFKWITEKFLLPIVMLVASLIIAAAVSGIFGG